MMIKGPGGSRAQESRLESIPLEPSEPEESPIEAASVKPNDMLDAEEVGQFLKWLNVNELTAGSKKPLTLLDAFKRCMDEVSAGLQQARLSSDDVIARTLDVVDQEIDPAWVASVASFVKIFDDSSGGGGSLRSNDAAEYFVKLLSLTTLTIVAGVCCGEARVTRGDLDQEMSFFRRRGASIAEDVACFDSQTCGEERHAFWKKFFS